MPDPTNRDWGLRMVRAWASGPDGGQNRRPLVGGGASLQGPRPDTFRCQPSDVRSGQLGTSPAKARVGRGQLA